MPKLPYQFVAITALIPTLIVSGTQAETPEAFTNKQLNEQSLMAVNWVQQSGEYRALVYQAFNIGKIIFDTAKTKNISRPAVIVDIDETVLDNSPYQAGLFDTNNGFELQSWNKWLKAAKAKAVPGSVEFVNYVNSNGGKVFFISNRDAKSTKDGKINDLEAATINNLKSVGFTGVNEQTVLLRGEFSKVINGKENNSKQWRLDAINNGIADGNKHTIVAFVGDSLNDFDEAAGRNNQQRRDYVDKNRNSYGVFDITNAGMIQPAYIAIPNPMYGNWEIGMYDPKPFNKQTTLEMTPGERSQQRKESLNRWLAD
ncbi:acid phosphatase (Class B) [Richelia sinica FACHB-800]|uniref:Acid phosphatase (Class B) n=1 Tax=Richelia sinica FACHB-800 TaxID=1357546 RepID=A0A975Y733_9NOST|nr:5'-nucleotidase, lipoprotein e(P4) family [Richelia sinica]MBD2665129.1 5'-nucleotidase, lipoprotein e(P4) family [Richelia sinica FACHB-800]QXE25918.1 acid phosphatase (Class B) [Richelia sinica FACHB-800]